MKRTYISGTEKYCTRKRHIAAPLLRKKFTLQKQNITAAKIEISAVGLYRLFLNGKEITKGFFAPYISNPEQVVYYDEYDVRDLLKSQNIVCIILGNGFSNAMDCGIWDFENVAFRAAPKVYLALYIDGEQVLTTDETFEVIESPITFDDLRAGERYDARKEADDIFTKDCIEGAGKPYVAKTPEGIYKKCEAQPVKAFETYGPVSITKSENGFLYDFGRNNAGVYKLRVNGKYGQKITLDFGELIKDGKIDFSNIAFAGRSRKNYVQHDEYICKEGSQEYMPSFTYHGYRYVYVKGITEEQAPNLLEYIVLHSDIPRTGQFSCSSEMLNKIYQCTLASDLANFYYFPTDCPQREKNGWTGDVMLSAEQLLYTFDCTASMREWLYNVRMAQRPNGSLPGIVPTAGWGYDNGMNGPAWDGALIETTYQLNRFSGNKQIIQENFEAIRLYITFLKSKINANGLLQFGLGDWCEVGCYENPSTSNEVTDTLTAINLLNKTEKMFANIGDQERCNETKSFRTSLTGKFKEKYVVQGKVQCAT